MLIAQAVDFVSCNKLLTLFLQAYQQQFASFPSSVGDKRQKLTNKG